MRISTQNSTHSIRRDPRSRRERRRGVVLLMVIAMLALFATVGLSFVYYSDRVGKLAAARYNRIAQTSDLRDIPPDRILSMALSQIIYGTDDPQSQFNGLDFGRNMYGGPGGRFAFSGTGYDPTIASLLPTSLPTTTNIKDTAEFKRGKVNVPAYTFPDLNNAYLGAIDEKGNIIYRSYFRGTPLRATGLPALPNSYEADVKNVPGANCVKLPDGIIVTQHRDRGPRVKTRTLDGSCTNATDGSLYTFNNETQVTTAPARRQDRLHLHQRGGRRHDDDRHERLVLDRPEHPRPDEGRDQLQGPRRAFHHGSRWPRQPLDRRRPGRLLWRRARPRRAADKGRGKSIRCGSSTRPTRPGRPLASWAYMLSAQSLHAPVESEPGRIRVAVSGPRQADQLVHVGRDGGPPLRSLSHDRHRSQLHGQPAVQSVSRVRATSGPIRSPASTPPCSTGSAVGPAQQPESPSTPGDRRLAVSNTEAAAPLSTRSAPRPSPPTSSATCSTSSKTRPRRTALDRRYDLARSVEADASQT